MGIKTVSCPTCGAEVQIGIPQGSEIVEVKPDFEVSATAETKTRPISCADGHEFAVEFTVGYDPRS